MKLSISNIGWEAKQDVTIYEMMRKYNFEGIEIAPTRVFPELPYEKINEAVEWKEELKQEYGFTVSSMQSIWYGRQEKVFGTEVDRKCLIDYTKQAIDFATAIGCGNLVFGCPRNRVIPEEWNQFQIDDIAIPFFKELGDYAFKKGTVLAMEANPPIYNTNYINDTKAALELVEKVDSKGFLLNLDVGTMIENDEKIDELIGKVHLINHVHISEPGLKKVQVRQLHKDLISLLKMEKYDRFVSVEMGKQEESAELESVIRYIESLI